MSTTRIGFIGYGNMGSALIQGALQAHARQQRFAIGLYRRRENAPLPPEVNVLPTPRELVEWADYIIPAVKPGQLVALLQDLAPAFSREKALVSIAAGVELAALAEALDNRAPVLRVMPNTPASVGHGLFGIAFPPADALPPLDSARQEEIKEFFSAFGQVYVLEEARFNAFTALAGCGPAFVYYFMDAMIEAGVTLGFRREDAAAMANSLFEGASALARQSADGPNVLREKVCSPGGVTIAGTNYLDLNAVRGHIVNCILASFEKGKKPS